VVGVVSRYMSNPGKQHWEAVKWILRYLRGTSDMFLCFTSADLKLQGYVDANLAGDVDSRKNTTWFLHTLGSTVVCWIIKVTENCSPFHYRGRVCGLTEAGKEMVWLQGFLDELGKKNEKGVLHSDS
jgi:hypothetical protein